MQNNLNFIEVEVAYARANTANSQLVLVLKIENKVMNIQEIIKLSRILELFPEIDLNINKVGIFGKIKDLNTINIKHGDRIEIYRQLPKDPNKIRMLLKS